MTPRLSMSRVSWRDFTLAIPGPECIVSRIPAMHSGAHSLS